MTGPGGAVAGSPLAVLGRMRASRSGLDTSLQRPGERCELCAEPIPDDHGHLVDLQARNLLCACRGCYLLFLSDGSGGAHFRAVPERYLGFPGLEPSGAQWESLQIPVGVAFFFYNSTLGQVAAFYPGPAGATESELPLDTWAAVVATIPPLSGLAPDVEAFIVRTERDGRDGECFIVPIDACYELVGTLRKLWRGFDGGREAHDAIEQFFARVRARAGVG